MNNIEKEAFGEIGGGVTAAKHNVQPLPSTPGAHNKTLVIVTARNPYDWLWALHSFCYCCNSMAKLDIKTFLQEPYSPHTFVDDNCPADLQPDGSNFTTTVIEMRRIKYSSWLSMREWVAALEFVHVEDLFDVDAQDAWFRKLAKKYCLPVKAVVQAVSNDARQWLSSRSFDPDERRGKSMYLNHTKWQSDGKLKEFVKDVNEKLDWAFEEKLGFKKIESPDLL